MFERYTMAARRIIFFARYEASEFGSPNIGPEHLLLGLLREGKWMLSRILPPDVSIDTIRSKIQQKATKHNPASTSLDLPLSETSKSVLRYAAEEADQLNHTDITTAHVLLGLLREDQGLAAQILTECGLTIDHVLPQLKNQSLEA